MIRLDELLKKIKPFVLEWIQGSTGGTGGGDTVTEGPGIDIAVVSGNKQVGLGGDSILLYHADGSPASEYTTPALACAAAVSGEVVKIERAGTYSDSVTVPAGVTLIGMGDNTILTGILYGPTSGLGMAINLTVTGDIATRTQDGQLILMDCTVSGNMSLGNGNCTLVGGKFTGIAEAWFIPGNVGTTYAPGSVISTGTIDSRNSTGITIATGLTPGDWYCIEASGRYNYSGGYAYNFRFLLNGTTWVHGPIVETNESGAYAQNDREYFQVGVTGEIKLRVNDSIFGDNSGSMDWTFRNVTITNPQESFTGAGLFYVHAVRDGQAGTPLQSDRSAWNSFDYPLLHATDIDEALGIHHTLGTGAAQAAAGNHTHATGGGGSIPAALNVLMATSFR